MTAMARRRPITHHPAFAPLVGLWFAALLGLGVAVLPSALLERALDGAGLAALTPLTPNGRLATSGTAALVGALLGLALALLLARSGTRDPRPLYAEAEPAEEPAPPPERVRGVLRVREELADGFADEESEAIAEQGAPAIPDEAAAPAVEAAASEEGFMILTPQPVHPPRPAPDLEALLEQFDHALATFRGGEEARPAPAPAPRGADPVHAFVARQTGAAAPSPLGGLMPDHQAELRAALDKLARAHRKD